MQGIVLAAAALAGAAACDAGDVTPVYGVALDAGVDAAPGDAAPSDAMPNDEAPSDAMSPATDGMSAAPDDLPE